MSCPNVLDISGIKCTLIAMTNSDIINNGQPIGLEETAP